MQPFALLFTVNQEAHMTMGLKNHSLDCLIFFSQILTPEKGESLGHVGGVGGRGVGGLRPAVFWAMAQRYRTLSAIGSPKNIYCAGSCPI